MFDDIEIQKALAKMGWTKKEINQWLRLKRKRIKEYKIKARLCQQRQP